MTAIALIAKCVNVTMQCVALLALARIFRNCFSELAGRWAVAFAIANLSVAYYGRVTNMDGPYLAWTVLAVDRIVELAKSGRPKDYYWFAVFVAAALATKDQAYASFALTGPLYLVVLPLLAPAGLAAGRAHFSALGRAALAGAGTYAVLSGALFNPSGFLVRLAMLTGTNSQDWKTYESSAAGWWANTVAILEHQNELWWPWPVVALAWAGVVVGLWPARRAVISGVFWRFLPLCAGLSSLIAFTLVVGRDAHRFVLPLGFWLSGYAGVAAARLLASTRGSRAHGAALVGMLALLGFGLGSTLELLVTQWSDPRRDVERYLAELPRGTRVETYGLGVYLPRFDLSSTSRYSVTHLRADPKERPPFIPGLAARVDDYSRVQERAPDVLVIPEAFAERFLPKRALSHRVERKALDKYTRAAGALAFFGAAANDELAGYTRLEVGQVALPSWYRWLSGRAVRIHGSTAQPIWVLKRQSRAPTASHDAR
jgi:hypothetical protein